MMGSSRNISDEVNKQSSEELSSLASEVLRMIPLYQNDDARASPDERFADLVDDYDTLLTKAKRLAGSVLSQDETPMSATDFESPV